MKKGWRILLRTFTLSGPTWAQEYAMQQSTRAGDRLPVGTTRKESDGTPPDAEVLAFRANFEGRSSLEELIRTGAQRMLQAAINAEVDEFLARHAARVDDKGRRLVVRNGQLPSRELLSGAGPLEVRQPRVRDNSPDRETAGRVLPECVAAVPIARLDARAWKRAGTRGNPTKAVSHILHFG